MTYLPMLRALRRRRRVPATPRPGVRWRAWAAVVGARVRRDARTAPDRREFRRPLRAGILARVTQRRLHAAAPRRASTLAVPPVGGTRPASATPTTLRTVVRRERVTAVPGLPERVAAPAPALPRPALRTAAAVAAPQRVRRLAPASGTAAQVRRPQRVEAAPGATAPAAAPGVLGPGVPRPALAAPVTTPGATLRGPAGPQPLAAPATGARTTAHGPAARGPATPPVIDDGELERLTDRIVTRLDDRLVAHRERFGRAF